MYYINLFFGVGLYKHMCNDSWYGNAKNRARTTFYWVNPKEISRSRTLFSVAHLSPSRRTLRKKSFLSDWFKADIAAQPSQISVQKAPSPHAIAGPRGGVMRKVRWYCDFCGLGAREEIPGQMDDFALTTPRGAAICTSCANRELKSGQTLMQWLEVHQEGARAGSCIPFKDQ